MNKNVIYISFEDIPITKNRKHFIKQIITNKGFVTYSDEKCTKIQCDKKTAYRSISELLQIVRSRYKITSLNAVVKLLKELIDENNPIAFVWCTQINKVVVKYVSNTPGNYITSFSRDKYYESVGVDGYSLKDYEDIINKL